MANRKWPKVNLVVHPSLKEPYPVHLGLKQDIFDDALSYVPTTDDIFVCTHPKSGTTWMSYALFLMRNDGVPLQDGKKLQSEIHALETRRKSVLESQDVKPRIIKSHLKFALIPMNSEAKYIYVARNPKDCIVSYYFHNKDFVERGFTDGEFDDFFEMYITGNACFGDYFESVGEWFEESKRRDNILFVLYEELKGSFER